MRPSDGSRATGNSRKEAQNAQTEDEVGRQEALPLYRVREDQGRPGRQAPRHDQTLERANPYIARHCRAFRLRDPARQTLDAIFGLTETEMSKAPRSVASRLRRKRILKQ